MKRSIIERIYPHKSVERIEKKISLLGSFCTYDAIKLLNIRMFLTVFIIIWFILAVPNGYLIGPIISVIFYIGSEYIVLDIPIKKRTRKLEKEAIFFLEVLLLTLESGRTITSALTMTSNSINSELSLEFRKALDEIKMGRSFSESLNHLKTRIPSDHINNAIFHLVESSIYGSSIEQTLNNQLDFLRDKELLEIRSEIGKLPTKISIISVVFFVPILLLVILSPVIINFISR